MKLIDRKKLLQAKNIREGDLMLMVPVSIIEEAPTVDAVPRTVYDQCAWERDLAIQQLRGDYGVGLGEKKKVVHGRWKNGVCPVCGFDIRCLTGENDLEQWVWDEGFNYCPDCGAKMDLED